MSVIANDTYADRAQHGTLGARFDSTPIWATSGVGKDAVVKKSANYTAVYTDNVIVLDATSAAITVTLPSAVGHTGSQFTIKGINNGTHAVTVATSSSQTIDGASTYIIPSLNASTTVVSDGANWGII